MASSSTTAESPWDHNIMGSVCRETLQRHQGSIGDAFVRIECEEGDYRLVLRDCVAAIAIDVHPSTNPDEALVEGTTSGNDGGESTADAGYETPASRTVCSESHTSLLATFNACTDYCVAIADDHLLSCDMPAWVKPCSQWIVRCLMESIIAHQGWPALPRVGGAVPSRGDLKRVIAVARAVPSQPAPSPTPLTMETQPPHIDAGASTPTPVDSTQRQPPPTVKTSTTSYAGLYVPKLPPPSSQAALSTTSTSTFTLKPLQVKDNTSTVSADMASKQASTLLGKPIPDEFVLKITKVGSYAAWRATICSAIDHFECSRQVSAEIVFRCIREPSRTRLKKKIPLSVIREEGHVAVIRRLDVSLMNRLELRAIDQEWRSLQQQPHETIPTFADRLEDVAHIRETLAGVPITDAEMSERLADGLTDPASIVAKSVVDPSLELPYEKFKQAMLGFLTSMDGNALYAAGITTATSVQQQSKSGPSRQISANQKSLNAKVHSAVAVELGLDSNACLRCGRLGHHAASCSSTTIHRHLDRCGRCGRLTNGEAGKNHKCNRSGLQCSRCHKQGHLSGVCRRGLPGGKLDNSSKKSSGTNPTCSSASPNDDDDDDDVSGLHIVETHTAKAVIPGVSNASCTTDTARFVNSLPKDPTLELRVGTAKRYCPVTGLVDSGANVSLISGATVAFLKRSELVKPEDFSTLPSAISIRFGDGKLLHGDTLVTLHCSFADRSLSPKALQFLVVAGCQPSCILGRNMFCDLGIRMVSDHGIPINGLSTAPSSEEGNGKSCTHDAGHCARSAVATEHLPSECIPLINIIKDPTRPGYEALQVHFEALEHANIEPFREAPRGRAPHDAAIIFLRLEDMAERGQVQRVRAEDCPIVCEICLVDKLEHDSSKAPRDPKASNVHRRFRVTVDCRPVNRLRLAYDSKGSFVYIASPGNVTNEVDKSKPLKQFLTTALLQVQDIPKERTKSFGRLDLQHAFYSLQLTPGLSRLFAVAAKDPLSRRVQHYRFTTLVQGWKFSSLLFGLATLKVVNEFIQPELDKRGIKVTVICYQDDLLFCGCTDADIFDAMAVAKDFLIKLNFNVNDNKQEGPVPVIDFCGMRLSSAGVTPSPSRTVLTEAAVDDALQTFVKGLPFYPKNKKARRRKLPVREYRTAWLRSWAGVANYMRGWLTPRILAATDVLQNALKDFGDHNIKDNDPCLASHIESVPNAFREVMGYYISGVPCMSLYHETDANHVATLLISDGNQHSWSGIVLRVVAQDTTLDHDHPLLLGSPSLNELLGTDRHLSVLPVKVFGGRFSKLQSTLSSTTRERMALLLLLEAAKTLLLPPVYSISDNANCTKEWCNFDQLNYGSWHSRYMIFQSYVDGVLWVPRDHPLPSLCDTMARCIEEREQYRHPYPQPPHQPAAYNSSTSNLPCEHLHLDETQDPSLCRCCPAAAVDDPLSSLPFPSLIRRCFDAWKTGTDFSTQCTIPLDPPQARTWLKSTQESDEHCQKLRRLVEKGFSKFRIDENGILRIKDKYVLPKRLGKSLALHVHFAYGHCGVKQTLRIVCRDFFCLRIADSVQRVVGKCYCQFVRARRGPLQPIISSLRRSPTVNDAWYIDTVGPLPTSDKHDNKYVLSIMDAASRYVIFLALPSITSKVITDTIDAQVFTLLGAPRSFIADNSSSFQSVHFRGWAGSWGIYTHYVPVYSANRNGALERQHSVLKQVLKVMCKGNTDNWPSYLPYAQKRCNNRCLDDASDYTPQQLFMGHQDASSLGRRFEDVSDTITADTVKFDAKRRFSRREAMVKEVHDVMEEAEAKAMLKYGDRTSRRRTFSVGQKVLKWIDNKSSGALQPAWTGPLTITDVIGTATYRLSDGSVHADRNLCLYQS